MRSQRPDRPGARGFLRPVLHRIRAQPQPQPQPPSEHRPETRSAEAVPLSRPGRQLRHERVIRELVDATTELLAELAESYPQLAADRLRVVGAPRRPGPTSRRGRSPTSSSCMAGCSRPRGSSRPRWKLSDAAVNVTAWHLLMTTRRPGR